MKRKLILLFITLVIFLTFQKSVLGQTATSTPIPTATVAPTSSTSATLTPTGITKLPTTGFAEASIVLLAVGAGIIVFAFVF